MRFHQRYGMVRLGLVLATMGFGACDEADPPVEKDVPFDVAQEDAAPILAEAGCDSAEACGCSEHLGRATAGCYDTQLVAWQARVAAGQSAGLTYDGTCVKAVVERIDSFACTTLTEEQAQQRDDDTMDPASCTPCKLFHGQARIGDPCLVREDLGSHGDDCAQGLRCDENVCVDPCERAGEGQRCQLVPCEDGLRCQPSSSEPLPSGDMPPLVCKRVVGLGELCGTAACADGLWCQTSDQGISTCAFRSFEGESCEDAPCLESLHCDPSTETCVHLPGLDEPCTGPCEPEYYCEIEPYKDAGVCKAKAVKKNGERCQEHSACISSRCDGGTCTADVPIVCYY